MNTDSTQKTHNFCIIAHIDHGKSTLADRMLEITKTVEPRDMKSQILDQMDLERERGITIKLQPVRMEWKGYHLNLIDTPGHIDFSYEVSRSLQAVEGAVLLVDATQGIQAQTLTNLYLAQEQYLTIIPVINKIDLPAADTESVKKDLISLLHCTEDEILLISAKTGECVTELLENIIERVPSPKPDHGTQLQGLIFDAMYDEYRGAIIYARIYNGSVKPGDSIYLFKEQISAEVLEVGFFKPSLISTKSLDAGAIGYIITNIKDLEKTKVGDTITNEDNPAPALPGYKDVKPMVFAGIYPSEGDDLEKLRKAIHKLKLNDSSLSFEPERSDILGSGFRCGFLGLLHLEIFQERLEREYDLQIVITSPTVSYHVYLTSGELLLLTSPADLPEQSRIKKIEQPIVSLRLITPKKYMGSIMNYVQDQRGFFTDTKFLDEERVLLICRLPLINIITDFYDTIKKISSGFASYSYDIDSYEECHVVRVDILVADEPVPGLASLVPRDEAERIARLQVINLKKLIPRHQFIIKIQATIGGKIIAAERISALRKDVTSKLYGGDVTRKRKLLEKQKKGKKRMSTIGSVNIPQKAFLTLLRRN